MILLTCTLTTQTSLLEIDLSTLTLSVTEWRMKKRQLLGRLPIRDFPKQ